MSLHLDKLQNVHPQGGKTLARCPACAETGHDAEGDHLVIYEQGHFACVVHPGAGGKEHRRRIFQLVGDCDQRAIAVRPALRQPTRKPIMTAILGRLGRVFPSLAYVHTSINNINGIVLGVPNVPKLETDEKLGRLGRVPQTLTYGDKTITNIKESFPAVPSVPKFKPTVRACYRSSPEALTDAARLSDWLATATLPVSFPLSAGECVIQAEPFRARLLFDLTCHHSAMFAPALDRARRVHDLFSERNPAHAN